MSPRRAIAWRVAMSTIPLAFVVEGAAGDSLFGFTREDEYVGQALDHPVAGRRDPHGGRRRNRSLQGGAVERVEHAADG